MADFEKMYHFLFNAMTDAEAYIDEGNCKLAEQVLRAAQIETEEMFISANEQGAKDNVQKPIVNCATVINFTDETSKIWQI